MKNVSENECESSKQILWKIFKIDGFVQWKQEREN